MKTKNIIFYLVGLLAFSSCEDMFEPADENNRPEEVMYEESELGYGLLIYAYDRLPYPNFQTTQTDIATDDAVINQTGSELWNIANGSWAADYNPTGAYLNQWDACKDGIQYVNLFLQKVDKIKWALSAASKQQMFIERMKGEAYTLRAIFYYYLLQAHGGYADDGVLYGVPLLLEPEDGSSDFNQPRATFADCISQIFTDCDNAIKLLPADYKNVSNNDEVPQRYKDMGANADGYNNVFGSNRQGLVSARVAECVKAQAALLAASPAFRDGSGVSAEKAADICAAALNRIDWQLDPIGNTWYTPTMPDPDDATKKIDHLKPSASERLEIVWRANRSNDNSQEKENYPPSLKGNGRVNPSQNLVDAFPMANGYPITESASGYDPKNPYAGRDPRLANTVIYNDMDFHGMEDKDEGHIPNLIKTGVNMPYGKDGNQTDDNLNATSSKSTRTGYYLKKLLREDCNVDAANTRQYHLYPRIRYTEIFLAYAEAANDAWDNPKDKHGNKMSAYDVIKAIRQRGGLPATDPYLEACANSKEKMTELIRNERRIELCFENKRFWDLRRWKMDLTKPVMGMKIEVDPSKTDGSLIYTVIEVEDRKFDNSYQCYGPLPKGEVDKWSELKQNKGW